MRTAASGFLALCAASAIHLAAGRPVAGQQPAWVEQLGYRADQVFGAWRGRSGMPFVDVTIGERTWRLLFDTGNTVGLTLATNVLDQLGLPEEGRWDSFGSDGRKIGTYRRARAPSVRLLGRTLTDQPIYEFSDSGLVGLVGTDALPGDRFTLDYRAELLAVGTSAVGPLPAGSFALPLTRSRRHPRMILAMGRVNGRAVLIEFDTGASRTNIDPQLARELALPETSNGVRIDSLGIGPLMFTVPSAKLVPKSGIDPALTPPIQLAVGSDILSQLVMTVDYVSGRLIVLRER